MQQAKLSDPALWQAIAEYPIGGHAAAASFVKRLARENAWRPEQAQAALLEYRRFCYLQRLSATGLTPSHAVDQVWHLHLLYTRDYWQQFCGKVLGFELHHGPALGIPGDSTRFKEQYAQTLARYEQEFGPADAQWWPGLRETFAPSNWQWHNALKPTLPQRLRNRLSHAAGYSHTIRRYLPLALVLCLALMLTMGVHAQVEGMGVGSGQATSPLDYSGGEFLSFYLKLLLAAVVLSEILRRVMTPKTEPSGHLTPAEIALLDGGEERAIHVLEVEQMAEGRLSYDPTTRLLTDTSKARGPQLAADLAALRQSFGSGAQSIRHRLLKPLIDSLQRRGLLLEPGQRTRIALISLLPLLAPLAFGVAKVNIGLSRNKPVVFLVLLLIFTAIVLLVQFTRAPRISTGVKGWLKRQRAQHARVSAAPTQQEWGKAVALFGLTAVAGTALADYVGWRQPVSSSSCSGSSNSSDSSSSDSSSDSGGDSGGSGCGGCGGGGGD